MLLRPVAALTNIQSAFSGKESKAINLDQNMAELTGKYLHGSTYSRINYICITVTDSRLPTELNYHTKSAVVTKEYFLSTFPATELKKTSLNSLIFSATTIWV